MLRQAQQQTLLINSIKEMNTQQTTLLQKAIDYINRCEYAGRTIDNLCSTNTYDAPVLAKLEKAWAIVNKYSK